MRRWYKFVLSSRHKHGEQGLLDLTNDMLGYQEDVGYEYYEQSERNVLTMEILRCLRGVLNKNHRVLSLGSGRGEHEICLIKEGFDIQLTDINKRIIDNTKKLFPDAKVAQLDILDEKSTDSCLYRQPYDAVFVPSLFYMLDEKQSMLAITNIHKLVVNGGILCLSFRSRDTWVTRMVDEYLCPIDMHLQALYKRIIQGQRVYVNKMEFGCRRKLDELSSLISSVGFTLVATDFSLCQYEVEARLPVFNRLGLSSLICALAGEKHPHLNFLVFAKDRTS
jgi:SAM-dependent methyltransferase